MEHHDNSVSEWVAAIIDQITGTTVSEAGSSTAASDTIASVTSIMREAKHQSEPLTQAIIDDAYSKVKGLVLTNSEECRRHRRKTKQAGHTKR
jgi:hypothetical protein